MRIAQAIELTENEIKTLTSWARGRRMPTRLMKRAKIVLMAAQGEQNKTIAELLGIDPRQVSRWRRGLFRSDWQESRRILHGVVEGRPSENRWHL